MLVVLSPCGTSLLTNVAEPAARKLVFRHANAARADQVGPEDGQVLQALLQKAEARLMAASPDEARALSAELNGILAPELGLSTAGAGHHLLVATDTWLGRETARLIEAWLTSHCPGSLVEVLHPRDMQTRDLDAFRFGLSDLVHALDNRLPGYRDSGFRIVFNLTGGFKGVLGFLQSVATIYVDEVVYIFEQSNQLLRIPCLPLRLDTGLVERHNVFLRRLLLNLPVAVPGGSGAGELDSLLLSLDGEITLSPWGEAFVRRCLGELYQEKLLPEASSRLRFHDNFRKAVNRLPADRRAIVNRRMDDLARCLEDTGSSFNPASLDFKPLQGDPHPPATHEIDAWHDRDAARIFGYFDDDGVFIAWQLRKHL